MAYQVNPESMRFVFVVLLEMTIWLGVAAVVFYTGRFAYYVGSALRAWMRGDDRFEITIVNGTSHYRKVIVAALVVGAASMAVVSADTVLNVCYGLEPESWAWYVAGCWILGK